MSSSTRIVWEIAQAELDKLPTRKARKARLKYLEAHRSPSGYLDIPTALVIGVLMAEFVGHVKMTPKQVADLMYADAGSGKLKLHARVDDDTHIPIPAAAFPSKH